MISVGAIAISLWINDLCRPAVFVRQSGHIPYNVAMGTQSDSERFQEIIAALGWRLEREIS